MLMSGNYQEGKEEGEWKNYWENGRLKNKSTFHQGQLEGGWVSYTPEGVVSVKGTYKSGLKVGEWLLYYSNGRLKEKQHYKIFPEQHISEELNVMGYKENISDFHGSYEAYSHIDFQLKEIGKYKKGQKNGTWTNYYPGGVVPTIVAQYKNGQLNGVFKQYDRYGHLVYVINYKNGLKHGEFLAYNENGKLVSRKVFVNGEEVNKKEKDGFIP
jgi:antitoxin component YwqK of YwqJK toxin-antitoxin module